MCSRIFNASCSRSSLNKELYYTDKKEDQIFLIYKEIQSGAVAKSYMRKGFLIYEEMRKYMRRPYMKKNLIFFFIIVHCTYIIRELHYNIFIKSCSLYTPPPPPSGISVYTNCFFSSPFFFSRLA
jgi:hypothetical protein